MGPRGPFLIQGEARDRHNNLNSQSSDQCHRAASGADLMRLNSLYKQVTAKIVAELEAGAIPWTKPWRHQHTGSVMPANFATHRPYSGVNIPILWGAAIQGGYERHQWLTFKQAKELGAKVKK